MSGPRDPWSDPSTETEPGAPYSGPPPTAPTWDAPPAPYGWPYPGVPPYGASPYGGAPWPPPAGPRRPGQVIAAAILAFVQAAGVALATVYVFLLASVISVTGSDPTVGPDAADLATEATVLAWVQLGSAVALVAGGILALTRRGPVARWTLTGALALQVALAVYWAVRLVAVFEDTPGPDPFGVVLAGALCFAAMPAVGLGLMSGRPARAWYAGSGDAARRTG